MRIALFPGTFDPIHYGHLEVLDSACLVFDHVVIAAFNNTKGKPIFSLSERAAMIRGALYEATVGPQERNTDVIFRSDFSNVEVAACSTLVADLAKERNATALVRGLRAVSDFEFELQIAQMNFHLAGIDTVFLPTSSATSFLSSRVIREVAQFGGDVSSLVPAAVAEMFEMLRVTRVGDPDCNPTERPESTDRILRANHDDPGEASASASGGDLSKK